VSPLPESESTWEIETEGGGVEVDDDGSEVDNDGLEEEDGNSVLWVRDEAAVCSEARDEAAVCSRSGIKDSRRRRHNGV
jgi:hypothetical protein